MPRVGSVCFVYVEPELSEPGYFPDTHYDKLPYPHNFFPPFYV